MRNLVFLLMLLLLSACATIKPATDAFSSAEKAICGDESERPMKDQPEDAGPVITDSVRPILDAGLADLVETDHRLSEEVSLQATPGHTPGHVSVWIRSRGEEAVITGDMIHHPCQMVHPDWSASVDFDQDQSRATRTGFLETCADRPVLVIGSHFAGPTAGRVVRESLRAFFRWF